jgi:group I intron endonuclease
MIIYKVTNKINEMSYIGQTKMTLDERKYHHYKSNRKTKFGKAIKDYNKDDFEWSIIDTCINKTDMDNKERYYINFYNTCFSGYNMTSGGEGGDTRSGSENSTEHRKKISKTLMGHSLSDETKKKISNTLKERYKNNPPFNESEIKDILNLHKKGKSLRYIASNYNTNHHKIKRLIKSLILKQI